MATVGGGAAPGVPAALVKAQQAVIVATVLVSWLLQWPAGILLVFLALLAGRLGGARRNVIFAVTRRLAPGWVARSEQEDAEGQRFNQLLALIFFGAALVLFGVGQPAVGWFVAGLVGLFALIALAGFCVGCFVYYHLKRLAGNGPTPAS